MDPKQVHLPVCKDWICVNFVLLQFRPMQVSYQYNDVKIALLSAYLLVSACHPCALPAPI